MVNQLILIALSFDFSPYDEEFKKREDFEHKFSKNMKKVDDQIKMLDEKIENLK